ncbi:arginine-hydroxylase NDUFAF5, mitochondrial-like, partial [Saccostrea cucullata]|uniref:arginine-hydroxylase NDUFAF5, mitochondrial-like n=1 Tax=Saccostrea cuccullata TaxID=36930 RepID=UPI002ED421FB
IQEINDYYFTLFKQCGRRTTNRIARGNKLRITLYSNHDGLTAKGFQLSLKVSKMSTRSTKSTKVPSPMSKTSMTKDATTTTKTENPQRTNIANKEIILSTKTASITEVTKRKTGKTQISAVFSTWKATKSTTPKVVMSEVLSSTPVLYTSSLIPHSTAATDETSKTTPVKQIGYRTYDRLLDIKREFDVGVDLGSGLGYVSRHVLKDTVKFLYQCELSEKLLRQAQVSPEVPTQKLIVDEEFLPFKENSLDVIVSSLSLHWVNDLPGCFKAAQKALKPDCPFILSMFGGDTLFELRVSLQLAEQEIQG